MSSPPTLYGLDAEISSKLNAKYTQEEEIAALEWVSEVTSCPISYENYHKDLKNGVILCKLLNCIRPDTVPHFTARPTNVLAERDNVQAYITGCFSIGVPGQDLFTISDLHEAKSLYAVIKNIYALGRQAQVIPTFNGPKLGVSYSVTPEEQQRRNEEKRKLAEIQNERARQTNIQLTLRREFLENEKKVNTLRKRQQDKDRATLRKQKRDGSNIQKTASDLRYERQAREQAEKNREGSIEISPVRFGMDAEIQKKLADKYDVEAEERAMDWIESVTGIGIDLFYDDLKSGIVLCELINTIQPGMIRKINRKPIALMERENIQSYLNACVALGVPPASLFHVSDLYERKSIASVVTNIHALARVVENRTSFQGKPKMGKQPGRTRQPSLRNYGSIRESKNTVVKAATTQSDCCQCTIL